MDDRELEVELLRLRSAISELRFGGVALAVIVGFHMAVFLYVVVNYHGG